MALLDRQPQISTGGMALVSSAMTVAILDALVQDGIVSQSRAVAIVDTTIAELAAWSTSNAYDDAVFFLKSLRARLSPT